MRLLDVEADLLIADYAKSKLSKRQMDCFRLLAGNVSVSGMEDSLGLHKITVSTHLQQLRLRLGLAGRGDVRMAATRLYGVVATQNFLPFEQPVIGFPTWLGQSNETSLLRVTWNLRKSRDFGYAAHTEGVGLQVPGQHQIRTLAFGTQTNDSLFMVVKMVFFGFGM